MKKIIVSNINDNSKQSLWEVSGFLPENYLFDAPSDAESIDDLDLDLENQTAVINETKRANRLAVEASRIAQLHINREALGYLASTDWYIIREIDSGEPCPDEIKSARAEARARIV